MYVRGLGITDAQSAANCAAGGGTFDISTGDCNAPPGGSLYTKQLGPGAACSWYDDIWATQGCLDWYAANDPTNPFYLTNTKGLIVGGAQVVGGAAGQAIAAAGNSFLGIDPAAASAIPAWAWIAGIGALALFVLPKVMGR